MSETGPDVSGMRISYEKTELLEADLASTPLEQFQSWLRDVVAVGPDVVIEPNAMVLSTADSGGNVSGRTVLLKGIDSRGLTFYTNYGSRKAQAIEGNSRVSVVFPWYPLHRQVTVIGKVSKVSREESYEYFKTRPHKSKLGAMVSAQSSVIQNREVLEKTMAELESKYPEGSEVPLPENWGGYLITCESVEFWQGRRSRLHDRLRFIRSGNGFDLSAASDWKIVRVSP